MRKVFLVILAMIFVFSALFVSISISAATVDKTELQTLVSKAENLEMENFNTTIYAWNLFLSELEYAQNVLGEPNATQAHVNVAVRDLSDAIARLGREIVQTEAVDTTELRDVIATAIEYSRADFDVDDITWNDFQVELAEAITIFSNQNNTQEIIDNAKNNLIIAMEALEQYRVAVEDDTTDPSSTQGPNGENGGDIQSDTPTESETVTAKPTKPATEYVEQTRPKSTTPFLQGGFIELGCDASVAFSALAIVGIIGSALVIKKKRD